MMIKDAMEKNEKATPNGADLEVLRKHFGMCFNRDGSLDLEKLKARLGDQVVISNEGYELKFLGKNYARLLTSLETTTVVCRTRSTMRSRKMRRARTSISPATTLMR